MEIEKINLVELNFDENVKKKSIFHEKYGFTKKSLFFTIF